MVTHLALSSKHPNASASQAAAVQGLEAATSVGSPVLLTAHSAKIQLNGAKAQMNRQLVAIAFGVVCLFVAFRVVADETDKGGTAGKAAAAPAAVSIEDRVTQGNSYMERMQAMLRAGFDSLNKATEAQNIRGVNCIRDAMVAMKGMYRLSQASHLKLQECAVSKDARCTEHEHQLLAVYFNKMEEMDGQLKTCGGPSMDGAVDGRIELDKEQKNIPNVDPTEGLDDLAAELDVPPSASPFLTTKSQG